MDEMRFVLGQRSSSSRVVPYNKLLDIMIGVDASRNFGSDPLRLKNGITR